MFITTFCQAVTATRDGTLLTTAVVFPEGREREREREREDTRCY